MSSHDWLMLLGAGFAAFALLALWIWALVTDDQTAGMP